MSIDKNRNICPVERAGGLDNILRKIFQNPKRILKPYIHEGMTVLDFGCGPGFFSVEIAKILNGSGKVIAADLQEGMLEKVRKKIKGTRLEQRIKLQKCNGDNVGIIENVDFILAFYVIHEVPDQDKLFNEMKYVLNSRGKILIVEPNFHVSDKEFNNMIERIKLMDFEVIGGPKVLLSRSVLLRSKEF